MPADENIETILNEIGAVKVLPAEEAGLHGGNGVDHDGVDYSDTGNGHQSKPNGNSKGATSTKPDHTAADAPSDDTPSDDWPILGEDAYYGLAGDYVNHVDPYTEADRAALLIQLLIMFGNVIGHDPYMEADGSAHFNNEFDALVGKTSKGRKGTAFNRVKQFVKLAAPDWVKNRIKSGLSSGEGLIAEVRDPIVKIIEGKPQILDDGIVDKRLLVIQAEFASTLRVMEREGNTLSPTLRDSFDHGNLGTMVKNNPQRATGAHISVIAHVAAGELRRYLTRTEMGNGFANRFLFACVRRSKKLPFGGKITDEKLAAEFNEKTEELAVRLRKAIEDATTVKEIEWDDTAKRLWAEIYGELSDEKPGLLGAVTARGEAHVLRYAMIYALLDPPSTSDPFGFSPPNHNPKLVHLKAALAVWKFSEASARWVFGESIGDPMADEIAAALKASMPSGMTRTEISKKVFAGNEPSEVITEKLAFLLKEGLAHFEKQNTNGGPRVVWFWGTPK